MTATMIGTILSNAYSEDKKKALARGPSYFERLESSFNFVFVEEVVDLAISCCLRVRSVNSVSFD